MSGTTLAITEMLSVFTLLANIFSVALTVVFIGAKIKKKSFREFVSNEPLLRLADRYSLFTALILSLSAVLGSLYYSDFAGFVPCTLCWIQRIFMFPLPVILFVGLLKNDRGAADYAIALASMGSIFSIYHSYLQLGGTPLTTCGATSVSCSFRYFIEFGYITIPFMTLSVFALIILLLLLHRVLKTNQPIS